MKDIVTNVLHSYNEELDSYLKAYREDLCSFENAKLSMLEIKTETISFVKKAYEYKVFDDFDVMNVGGDFKLIYVISNDYGYYIKRLYDAYDGD